MKGCGTTVPLAWLAVAVAVAVAVVASGCIATGVGVQSVEKNTHAGVDPEDADTGHTDGDPDADPGTDPGADPVTDPVVDPGADPVTDPVVDPGADPVTDPVVDPDADPVTDPVVDPGADPVTDPDMDPGSGDDPLGCVGDEISADEDIGSGEYLCSPDGAYRFGLDDTGKLVLLAGNEEIWNPGTLSGVHLAMRGDGNLVLYGDADVMLWGSATGGNSGARVGLDDGGVVSVHLDGAVLWSLAANGLPECPHFAPRVTLGRVPKNPITETSGIVSSRFNPGVLWVHNDSGGRAEIYAITETGDVIGTVGVSSASNIDWEDMETGPAPGGGQYLYIADFGDNGQSRSNVVIYRVLEPRVLASDRNVSKSVDSQKMTVTYPGGAKNAETLLVDPRTSELFIVTKGSGTIVFKLSGFSASSTVTPVEVARINKSNGGVDTATGGSVSPDGRAVIVREYGESGRLWRRPPGASLEEAFSTSPCDAPFASRGGGEAVAFASDGSGYFALSEHQENTEPLHFMAGSL